MIDINKINACLICVAALSFSIPARAAQPYDGQWRVTVTTLAGSCDRVTLHPLVINDGRITGIDPTISGKVNANGSVRVSMGSAFANGQLNESAGSGKWNAASGGVPCSGRWVATLVSR